jgi:hypothetical protein
MPYSTAHYSAVHSPAVISSMPSPLPNPSYNNYAPSTTNGNFPPNGYAPPQCPPQHAFQPMPASTTNVPYPYAMQMPPQNNGAFPPSFASQMAPSAPYNHNTPVTTHTSAASPYVAAPPPPPSFHPVQHFAHPSPYVPATTMQNALNPPSQGFAKAPISNGTNGTQSPWHRNVAPVNPAFNNAQSTASTQFNPFNSQTSQSGQPKQPSLLD